MTTRKQKPRGTSPVFLLWNWLTEPTAAIKDFEVRLKSRWMAAIFVVFVPFGLLIAMVPSLVEGRLPWKDQIVQVVFGLMLLLMTSYYLSRRGYYKIAALIAIGSANLTVYGLLLIDPRPSNAVSNANFLIAMVVFSSILMSHRTTAILLVINVIGLLLQFLLIPAVKMEDILKGPLSLLVVTFALVEFGAYLRTTVEKHHVAALQAENVERQRVEERLNTSLQEKDILLKEIHHRVKNNLQIITSLLNLQSAKIHDPLMVAQYQDSQNRIRSMALIHEQLYGPDDLAHIDFGSYLRDLIGPLAHTYGKQAQGITLRVETDGIVLDVDTAIPCGLLVNELVSNALKHAFPDGRGGEIMVALRREAGGRVQLVVQDDGIGFPSNLDYRQTTSLGLQLVNSLARQIRATMELNNLSGTTFEIEFAVATREDS